MIETPSGKTLDELTRLVQESMSALGLSNVLFAIRPLPFEFRNWYIDARSSAKEELSALNNVAHELREKYYLLLSDFTSPYAA
jgi:hypothetical protein